VYVLSHNNKGAIGLVINHAVNNVDSSVIFQSFNIENSSKKSLPVHFGGPIEAEKGFILHTNDYNKDTILKSEDNPVALSSNLQILKDIAAGSGPEKSIFALGYAGWGAGQLENELNNFWIRVPFDKEIVFANDDERKWELALGSAGIKSYTLSSQCGHA
jgi:putative transcriptional regulator